MKKALIMALMLLCGIALDASAQIDEATAAKRAARRNMVVKEWNTDAKTKTRWMDRVTTYNDKGEKLEEIEYNRYGQAWRKTFEYGPNGKIVKETEYDDRDKVVMIRKFEHNPDNTKKKQYNYSPKGHLLTVKIFEYSYDGPEAEN